MWLAALDPRVLVAVTTGLSLVALALAVQVSLSTTAIADDYTFVSAIPSTGVVTFLHDYWTGLTDRYANAVLMVATLRVLGPAALQITPVLLLGLLCFFAARIARAVGAARSGRAVAPAVGVLAASALIVTAPSIFDTVGWYTAVAIYLAGVVAGIGVVARVARLATGPAPPRRRQILISFVTGVVAAGFTELIGIEIIAAALLALLHAGSAAEPGHRRLALQRNLLAIAAGGAVGIAVIFLGPGSQARAVHAHATLALGTLAHALADNLFWLHYEMGWRLLPAAGVGLVVWRLTRRPLGRETSRWLLIWSAFLFVVPLVILALATGYSGAPLATSRTAFVAGASMAAGTAILAYALAAMAASAGRRACRGSSLIAVAAIGVGIAGFASTTRPVIAAEHLRAQAVAARAASVRAQLARHPPAISLMPAPLIDPMTGAYDLIFGNPYQFDYVLASLRTYYRVPTATQLHVVWTQPRGYCIAGVGVHLLGVRPCT